MYNIDEAQCCLNQIIPIIDEKKKLCCRNTLFDLKEHSCCRGTLNPKTANHYFCCGFLTYDITTHQCCEYTIVSREPGLYLILIEKL
jgi:hypothetical protein